MWLPGTHSLKTNGPRPTGALNHLCVLMSTPASPRMWRGRMPNVATRSRKGASTVAKRKTTVVSSGVSTPAILFQPARPRTSTAGFITV